MTASRIHAAARRCAWPALAAFAALAPFLPALVTGQVFYARDLAAFFWGRYLWLRRAWLWGEWPLWDPHLGAGQAAHADALHQMFLPPAVLVRLVGGETLGFNLWLVTPFPLAAVGTWLFLVRRVSAPAAALGAIAFAMCGPVVASGNFPNLSWSVALLPWVLWALDRVIASASRRRVAMLAAVVALQCLAGEPVTFFTTGVLAGAYALAMGRADAEGMADRLRPALVAGAGFALGLALAAVQLVPMVVAAVLAARGQEITPDAWSLRPTALLETIWPHLYGDYFTVQSITETPWMPLMYTGREPLLFSIYLGVPLLALAIHGLAGTADRRTRLFWTFAAIVSLVASFGSYTPIYPFLRDHVPPFGTFRFPVKYVYPAVMAVAVGAALGWDRLQAGSPVFTDVRDGWRRRRAGLFSIGFALAAAGFAAAFAAACLYLTESTSALLDGYASLLNGQPLSGAAAFMIDTVPLGAVRLMIVAFATAGILARILTRPHRARRASWALAALICADLAATAPGANPSFDAEHFTEPAWVGKVRADPGARFYVGGKIGGTLNAMDYDSSRGFVNKPGLAGSASRATLSLQAAFYPSAYGVRELLSYDLPVLWPGEFGELTEQFVNSKPEQRDRMLDRTGVRYRVLPQRRAGSRTPLIALDQFTESFLFDWENSVTPRISVVPRVRVVREAKDQIAALFEPGWDAGQLALVDRPLSVAGNPGAPVDPYARIVADEANRLTAEAGAGSDGGYVLLLDSYSTDWHVTVDRRPATLARANGVFRVVRIPPGRHDLRFEYRPYGLVLGASVSLVATLCLAGIALRGRARRRAVVAPQPALVYADQALAGD